MRDKTTIDRLIINSSFEEPKQYWSYDRETRAFSLAEGRRPAGYVTASESFKEEHAEALRQTVNTVGQAGKPGGQIQKVISVRTGYSKGQNKAQILRRVGNSGECARKLWQMALGGFKKSGRCGGDYQ